MIFTSKMRENQNESNFFFHIKRFVKDKIISNFQEKDKESTNSKKEREKKVSVF